MSKRNKSIFIPIGLILGLLGQSSCYHINTNNQHEIPGEQLGECQKTLEKALNVEMSTVVMNSADAIYGKWVSESCEVRPGPEFLLRSYTFFSNSSFKLTQFYYRDEFCTDAAYTIVARGLLRRNQYNLQTVTVVPHASDVAYHLTAKVNSTCPGHVRKRWKAYKEYILLNKSVDHRTRSHKHLDETYRFKYYHSEKFNCLEALSLVFHELNNYEIQIRQHLDDNLGRTYYRQELLLGDIHTKLEARESYKEPTAFQVPLLRVDISVTDLLSTETVSVINKNFPLSSDLKKNTNPILKKSYLGYFDIGPIDGIESIFSTKSEEKIGFEDINNEITKYCPICVSISEANEKQPPHLTPKSKLPFYLNGEWISTRCEQRPKNLFLTRHFRFYSGDHTWIVEYKFYYNSICSGQSFSVTAAGHYKIGSIKNNLKGGTEVDFHLEKGSLTVFDQKMMIDLEQDPECGVGRWKLGEPREMSATHGCPSLGLIVPNIEYDLMKMELSPQGSILLYMGQVETDTKRRGSKERPTSYQPPLVQCQALPQHSENLREILGSRLYGDESDYGDYTDSADVRNVTTILMVLNLFLLALIS